MHTQDFSARAIGALHVTDLAKRTGVTPATVRYYSRVGLLSPEREPENGYRLFSKGDLRRVEFIRQAQALGLKIEDIKEILKTVALGETPCQQVRDLVEQRQAAIREEVSQLQSIERRIEQALESWRTMPANEPHDGQLCPLIEQAVPKSCCG